MSPVLSRLLGNILTGSAQLSLPGHSLRADEDAWDVEKNTRIAMTVLLRSHIAQSAPGREVIVHMSDVDEIPSSHTLSLLKACDFGSAIHLQLRDYIYRYVFRSATAEHTY